MVIAIEGTQTGNKGAQLMLEAIVDILHDKSELALPPQDTDFFIRTQLGLRHTIHHHWVPIPSALMSNLISRRVREWYGITAEKEITGVVDASGFKFSDSFTARSIRNAAKLGRYRANRGIPLVLLPQAFGPFEDAEKAKWSKVMLESASKVFVRDQVSAGYLETLKLSIPVELCPDFTLGLEPVELDLIDPNPFAAIIPNMKLITSGKMTKSSYINRLLSFGEAAKRSGLNIVVVVHESGDLALSKEVARQLSATTFTSEQPRVLKAALGQAELVMSSRFHAVVGALAQGVPTIAIGWSHKYQELLADFGVEDWIANDDAVPESFVVDVLGDKRGRQVIKDSKSSLLAKVDSMWSETLQLLNI